jgi:putative DNA primase/helicase
LSCGGRYLLPPIVGTDFNDAINTWRDAASMEVEL